MTSPDLAMFRFERWVECLQCQPHDTDARTGREVAVPALVDPQADEGQDAIDDLAADKKAIKATFILEMGVLAECSHPFEHCAPESWLAMGTAHSHTSKTSRSARGVQNRAEPMMFQGLDFCVLNALPFTRHGVRRPDSKRQR